VLEHDADRIAHAVTVRLAFAGVKPNAAMAFFLSC
jgi:hypothetical protein